jgi:serine/threonine-protein kinase RsbW
MKTITCQADMEHFDVFLGFIDSCSKETGFEKNIIHKIRLACEEIIINIIKYAYPGSKGEVTIQCRIEPSHSIYITFIDKGFAFNPLEIEEPDIESLIQERQIGGLGIFIVKKVMDEVLYRREEGNNILTIVKSLGEKHC